MRIIRASRDQSDPVYGPRAGNQCMSNCFMFLHTSYLVNVESILDTDSLDIILDNGAKLDAKVEKRLKHINITTHVHRLGSEILNVIESPLGITGHALSRPFNGTAETQDLGGYKCLGILDFLTYARSKNPPTYVVITVGAHTRGLVLTKGITYVFDPHTTDLSKEAAVYCCDDLNEVISALSFFGTLVGDFYYDASIIFFTHCNTASISTSDLMVKIMNEYKDPDIDIQNVVLPTDNKTTPSKLGKRRRPSETQVSHTAKSSRHTRKLAKIPEEITDLIVDDIQIIERFRTAISPLPITAPKNWTILHKTNSFHEEYFKDIGRQLLAYEIDAHVGMKKITDNTIIQRFEDLMGLSEETDSVIASVRNNDLLAPLLYKHYILTKSDMTITDLLLSSKITSLFTEISKSAFGIISAWLNNLLNNISVKNASITDCEIENFISNNPLPFSHTYACLTPNHVKLLSDMIAVKKQALKSKYAENDALYRKILDAIAKLGLATDATVIIKSSKISHLDDEQLSSLKQAARAYATTAYESCLAKMTDMLTVHHNRILTGSLPDKEIIELSNTFASTLDNTASLQAVNLIDDTVATKLNQLLEDLLYLHEAKIKVGVTPSESIKKLRSEYDTARKQISDKETRIKELIENMEDMITDPPEPAKESLNLVRTQIQEVETMTIDEMDIERTDKVMDTLTILDEDETKAIDFIQTISSSNIPSPSDIKSLKSLKHVLEYNENQTRAYVLAITRIIEKIIKKLSDKDPPSDDTLSRISMMVDQLPNNQVQNELIQSLDIVSQLSRRIKYTINQKHSLQSLEDILTFFSENNDTINKIIKTNWGKQISTIYKKTTDDYSRKIEENRESEWLKRIKDVEIDSPQTLEKLLAEAPNKTILNNMAPELHAKLRKKMEDEANKRSADLKRLHEEQCKKLDHDLKTISDSFVSNTPSVFSSIDLKGSRVFLNKLGKHDKVTYVTTFNANMSKSLTQLMSDIGKLESELILSILRGVEIKDGLWDQKHIDTLENNTNTLLQTDDLLLEEVQGSLLSLSHKLVILKHMKNNRRDPKNAFFATPFSESYMAYSEFLHNINKKTIDTRAMFQATYDTLSKNIHDNTTHSDVTIKDIDVFSPSFKNTAKNQPTPFSTEILLKIQASETELKDFLADINLKLKTKLDRYIQKRTSIEARWKEIVLQHRIRAPDGFDIDTTKLTTDTVTTVHRLLTLAENTLPYITSKRALEWLSEFIIAAIKEKKDADNTDTIPQLTVLSDKCIDLLKIIDEKIIYNTKIETEALESVDVTQDTLSNLKLMLDQLDPRRIVGGDKRFKMLSDMIIAKQNKLTYAEELEKLSSRYFELVKCIREFKYGLNFDLQLQKIRLLKTELSSYKRDSTDNDIVLPDYTQHIDTISTSSLLMGLSALERYVAAHRSLLDNFISTQPLISDTDTIPTFHPHDIQNRRDDKNRIDLAKMSACDITTPLFKCIDVFGEKRPMTSKGIQLYLYATHGNFIFETFSHVRARSTRQKDNNHTVTRRYRSVTVAASIAATLQTFWSEVSKYDIRNFLDDMESSHDTRVNTIINLKLFVYIITTAWSEATIPIEPDTSYGTVQIIDLLDFTTLMAALHPEFVYATATSPISSTLADLIVKMDRKTVDEAMNTNENPPRFDMCDLKAFCIDSKKWKSEDIRHLMWMSDLIKQMCTSNPKNRDQETSTKLFLYMLSVRILPRDIIRCLWTQFKPAYAFAISSMEDLVSFLSESFFRTYSTSTEIASGHLQTGEKIERQLILRQKVLPSILDDFTQQESVLDYILGSYAFGIPITCGIHVANIIQGRFRLVVRHLENVPNDPDFVKVVRSRDLTFEQFNWSCTTQNLVERSWFSIQEERLKYLLQNPTTVDRIPLVIYNSSTNYVVSTVLPPSKSISTEPLYIAVNNPFSAIRVQVDNLTVDRNLPSSIPLNIDFLRKEPPKLHANEESLNTNKTDTQSVIDFSHDSVPDQSLNEPLFSQTKVSTIVPKDTVTTVSTDSVSQTFSVHPFRALSSAIRAAIEILQETRIQLDIFESDVCDAIRRIKILYLH
nr:large tegument protein [Mastomys natalensis cytomegalovirus 3]WEG70023.1 large tegument protein [Mastomys natalensis cytomegalovirus 3]WEG70163.1 large tegument protein [Mastomys natalensis cytomegalovirus 3]WEG70723.1 large tegument protein [Mastomys natalensis cytomegalovirus 3]